MLVKNSNQQLAVGIDQHGDARGRAGGDAAHAGHKKRSLRSGRADANRPAVAADAHMTDLDIVAGAEYIESCEGPDRDVVVARVP
jgi:hypothetical protein